jgi:hypothetical protein
MTLKAFIGNKDYDECGMEAASILPYEEKTEIVPTVTTVTEPFKYAEGKILDDLRVYLANTYGQHYVGKNNIQANDLFLAGDRAEARGFWKWNAVKYLLRYGKKGGHNKADLLKALHYIILVMYLDHEQDNGESE